jgi:hypothetical protein
MVTSSTVTLPVASGAVAPGAGAVVIASSGGVGRSLDVPFPF